VASVVFSAQPATRSATAPTRRPEKGLPFMYFVLQ
jgi:hypothetical protein